MVSQFHSSASTIRASRKDLIKRVLVGALASNLRFDIAESKLAQLELFYEDIDHPNRVVLIDPARRGSCIRPGDYRGIYRVA